MRIPALSASLFTAALVSLVGGQTVSSTTLNQTPTKQTFALGEVAIVTDTLTASYQTEEQIVLETTEVAQEIETPTVVAPEVYIVSAGDSLSKIAKEKAVTVQRLFDANVFIENPNIINPGEKIVIPIANEVIASRVMPIAPKPIAKEVPKSTNKKIVSNAPAVIDGSVWDALAACESGGNWAINTGNGYSGGLQFLPSTWRAVGGTGLPHQNSREEQILRGQILQARSGWGQWPACTKKLGLR